MVLDFVFKGTASGCRSQEVDKPPDQPAVRDRSFSREEAKVRLSSLHMSKERKGRR